MLARGIYPASITPMRGGELDVASLMGLLEWFIESGCAGAVLAGTNGEGPSLGIREKKRLVREASRSGLTLIIGVNTSAAEDAIATLCEAAEEDAQAGLVMPPSYFREAVDAGLERWYTRVLDGSPIPLLAYNLPARTGVSVSYELLRRLGPHERLAGIKDSSGEVANLAGYAEALSGLEKSLFVGNELLLRAALEAGWSGSISGAANVIGAELVRAMRAWQGPDADAAFGLADRALKLLRGPAQPGANKALLALMGRIASDEVAPPLAAFDSAAARKLLADLDSAAISA